EAGPICGEAYLLVREPISRLRRESVKRSTDSLLRHRLRLWGWPSAVVGPISWPATILNTLSCFLKVVFNSHFHNHEIRTLRVEGLMKCLVVPALAIVG